MPLKNPRIGSEFSSGAEMRLCQRVHLRHFHDPVEKNPSIKPRTTSHEIGYLCATSQPPPLVMAERSMPEHKAWEFSRKGCAETDPHSNAAGGIAALCGLPVKHGIAENEDREHAEHDQIAPVPARDDLPPFLPAGLRGGG